MNDWINAIELTHLDIYLREIENHQEVAVDKEMIHNEIQIKTPK